MNKEKRQNKRLRKDDTVLIIAGNFRGMTGKVLSRTDEGAIVQGINIRKKHVRGRGPNQPGKILELEKPIHVSNMKVVVDEAPVKLKTRTNKANKRELYYKKDKETVPYRTLNK